MSKDNLEEVLFEFLESFEKVFHHDWKYTKEMLCIFDETEEQVQDWQQMGLEPIDIISSKGTFLNPKVGDETEDWGNRGELLEKYRMLKDLISNQKLRAER